MSVNDNQLDKTISVASPLQTDEKKAKRKIFIFSVLVGQIISFIIVGVAQFSEMFTNDIQNRDKKENLFFTSGLNAGYYFFFWVLWIIINKGMHKPKFYFFFLILSDTSANFFKLLSMNNSDKNIYPFIINGASILFTCLFTWIFIKKYKYTYFHIIGAILSFVGVVITFYGATYNDNKTDIFTKYTLIALGSSVCFSISYVLMEYFFKTGKEVYEYFTWSGLLGAVISLIQSVLLGIFYDPPKMSELNLNKYQIYLEFIGFVVLFSLYGMIMPFYIKRNSAVMFNISLVSQIFWANILQIIIYRKVWEHFLYYIGFFIILMGVIMFGMFKVVKDQSSLTPQSITEEVSKDALLGPDNSEDNYANSIQKRNSVYRTRQASTKYN